MQNSKQKVQRVVLLLKTISHRQRKINLCETNKKKLDEEKKRNVNLNSKSKS